MHARETRLAKLSAVAVLFLFSITPFLVKTTSVDPFAYSVVRSLVACLIIPLLARRAPKLDLSRYSVVCIVSGAVSNVLFLAACHYTDVTSAVAVTYSWVALVPIVGWLWLRTRTAKRDLVLLGFGAVGLVLIFADQKSLRSSFDIGKLMALGSGIAWAIYIVSNTKLRGGADMAFYVNVVSALMGAAVFAVSGAPLQIEAWDWVPMILNGVANGLVMLCFNYSLKYWNTYAVTVVVSAELAISPLWVIVFLGERPGALVWAGMAVMIVTMLVALVRPAGKEEA
ncbi:MAG: DMT family transporter [Deltaproteobacteria bacterium]|nr:DMT family transporter [Deltaproteobacteria bacterium]